MSRARMTRTKDVSLSLLLFLIRAIQLGAERREDTFDVFITGSGH